MIIENIRFSKGYYLFLITLVAYTILNIFTEGAFYSLFTFVLISNFTIAYVAINIRNKMFFIIYEKIIYWFVIISLIFYIPQLFYPQQIFLYLQKFNLGEKYIDEMNQENSNFIIYTAKSVVMGNYPRNCGFTWEPGPFSIFIDIAIIMNLIRNKFKFNNKYFYILLLGLISTFSTTGFLAFFIIMIWNYLNYYKKSFKKIYILPIIGIFIFLFYSLPFLENKISKETENSDLNYLMENAGKSANVYSPGRFVSFDLALYEFKKRPIFGFGGHIKSMEYFGEINIVNGIGMILARFGLFGIVIFIYSLYRSSFKIANDFNYKSPFLIFIPFLIFAWSFNIMDSSLFLFFTFYFLFKIRNR